MAHIGNTLKRKLSYSVFFSFQILMKPFLSPAQNLADIATTNPIWNLTHYGLQHLFNIISTEEVRIKEIKDFCRKPFFLIHPRTSNTHSMETGHTVGPKTKSINTCILKYIWKPKQRYMTTFLPQWLSKRQLKGKWKGEN